MKYLYLIIFLCLPWALHAQDFPLPEVPFMVQGQENKANYLAVHYWDRFDFKDNALIDQPEVTEQGFVNFISIMPYVTERREAFAVFAERMTQNPKMLQHLMTMAEHYLFDNFSPVYDEELYLMLVEELLKQSELSLVQKERLRFQRRLCLKNRVNQVATDFDFVLRNGKWMSLKEVKADYLLLYLNDPECDACRKVKKGIEESDVVSWWMKNGRLKVLSVCTEGKTEAWKNLPAPAAWIDGCDVNRNLLEKDIYDLRNMPAVYLLDANKRILMKNATQQKLEQLLMQLK